MPVRSPGAMTWGGGRTFGIGSIITIGAGMMAVVAIIGMVISFSNVIESTYMQLAFETPKFQYAIVDGAEHGNEMLEIYKTMRIIGAGLFVLVLVFAGVGRLLESAELGIIPQGMANRMISKSLLFLLIIFVFPPIWDMAADGMTNIAYWVLNPAYSFDQEHDMDNDVDYTMTLQCPHAWGIDAAGKFDMALYRTEVNTRYMESPYIPSYQKVLLAPDGNALEPNPADTTGPDVLFQDSGLYNSSTIQVRFTEPIAISPEHIERLAVTTERAVTRNDAYNDVVIAAFAGPPVTGNAEIEFGIHNGMQGLKTSGRFDVLHDDIHATAADIPYLMQESHTGMKTPIQAEPAQAGTHIGHPQSYCDTRDGKSKGGL